MSIGGGVELWRGYFQSVRPAVNRLLINVDVTAGVMYKSGSLLELCLGFFNESHPHALAPSHGFTLRNVNRLSKFLSNVFVRTIYNNKRRKVMRVSQAGARELTFNCNGTMIDISRYFQLRYNITLHQPEVVCAEVGHCLSILVEYD